MVETLDTCILESDDEGGSSSSSTTDETRLIVGDKETDDGKGGDVDEGLWAFLAHIHKEMTYELTIRQKVPLTAAGMDLRGLGVSEAAKPTSSVPAKANAAVTKTEQTPLKPFEKAPGFCHMEPPMYVLYLPLEGPPPQMQTLKAVSRDTKKDGEGTHTFQ